MKRNQRPPCRASTCRFGSNTILTKCVISYRLVRNSLFNQNVDFSTQILNSYKILKNAESNKNLNVRSEQELIYHFRELLKDDPDLGWADFQEAGHPDHGDGCICLHLDGRTLEYQVKFKLKPSIPLLEHIRVRKDHADILLVVPHLTNRVLHFCKKKQLSCIDLNGRAWLRAEGLLVDRRALPGRSFSYQLEPRNVFAGKSGRIVRSLLTGRDQIWTQAELVKRTHASSGMVSRLVQYFVSQSYLKKLSAREYRINDFDGLLDDWIAADEFQERCSTNCYAGPIGNLSKIAHALQEWSENESVKIAFTQWVAALERHPYTEPAICSAYVQRLPDSATLESLGLRPVEEVGKVWLHVPKDEGVFLETQSTANLDLVTDAQIYIDLKSTGLRGPEAAQALREWEGFCHQ